MEYLHELLKQLDAVSTPSFYLVSKVFKAFRKSKIRRPDIYALHGPSYCESLGKVEKFAFFEHIFVGALDSGDLGMAQRYLDLLSAQFPASSRVQRLQGMLLESTGNFEEALTLYDEVLQANPANMLVMKRKVAALRSQGKPKEAIEALHAILKVFQADTASWLELADLHLSLCDYQSAAFCYEEVILVMPTSAPLYCRLAECLYTLGGGENLVKARQYYSVSLNHQRAQNNSRALYGLLATCREIQALSAKKVPEGESDVTAAMYDWCLEQLAARAGRKGCGGDVSAVVAAALSSKI